MLEVRKSCYLYYVFSNKEYTIQAGDILEYDIYLDGSNPQMNGGIDLVYSSGINMRDTWVVKDQNGLYSHPCVDIGSYANGAWYHRSFDLSNQADNHIVRWQVAHEGDISGSYTLYIDNAKITNNGIPKVIAYRGGIDWDFTDSELIKRENYKCLIVPDDTWEMYKIERINTQDWLNHADSLFLGYFSSQKAAESGIFSRNGIGFLSGNDYRANPNISSYIENAGNFKAADGEGGYNGYFDIAGISTDYKILAEWQCNHKPAALLFRDKSSGKVILATAFRWGACHANLANQQDKNALNNFLLQSVRKLADPDDGGFPTPTPTATSSPAETPTPTPTPTRTPSDTGWHYPSACGIRKNEWHDPQNAYAEDSTYLNADGEQDYYNFSFTIPPDSTINGIELGIKGYPAVSVACKLTWDSDGAIPWTSAKYMTLGTSSNWNYCGGSTDTWGRVWSASDFTNGNFCVQFDVGHPNTVIFIDAIKIKVYYTPPAPTPTNTPTPEPTATPTMTPTMSPASTPTRALEPPVMTNIARDEATGNITIYWESSCDVDIYYAADMQSVFNIAQSNVSGALWIDDGSRTGGHPNGASERYYKIACSGTSQYASDTVGMFRYSLVAGNNLICLPLIPYNSDIDVVFGSQLTEGSPVTGDRIYTQNPNYGDAMGYAYLSSSSHEWMGTLGEASITPEKGYYVKIRAGHTRLTQYTVGKVPSADVGMPEFVEGNSLIGEVWPVDISLAASNLKESGANAGSPLTSDRIYSQSNSGYGGGLSYGWLSGGDGMWHGTLTGFRRGYGCLYKIRNGNNPFSWMNLEPYSAHPSQAREEEYTRMGTLRFVSGSGSEDKGQAYFYIGAQCDPSTEVDGIDGNRLEVGDLVQVIYSNGEIDPPDPDDPNYIGGDDELLGNFAIGDDEAGWGEIGAGEFTISVFGRASAKVYLRVWNAGTIWAANNYGETAIYNLDDGMSLPPDYYLASFSTNKCKSVTEATAIPTISMTSLPSETQTETATATPTQALETEPTATPTPFDVMLPTPTPDAALPELEEATPTPVPSLKMLSPNGGELMKRRNTVVIRWESTGEIGENVRLGLIRNGAIQASITIPDTGSFTCIMPTSIPKGNNYQIGVQSILYPNVWDASDEYFTIR